MKKVKANKKKQSLFTKIFNALDKAMKNKAKKSSCCCSSKNCK